MRQRKCAPSENAALSMHRERHEHCWTFDCRSLERREGSRMFKWFKSKANEQTNAERQVVQSAGSAGIAAAVAPASAIASPARTTVKKPIGKSVKLRLPVAGMPAQGIIGKLTKPMSIVAVQANGRKVLAKPVNGTRVHAFTLRADKTYRLLGAPDASEHRLVLAPQAAKSARSRSSVFAR